MDVQQLIMLLTYRDHHPNQYASYELLHYPKALADSEGYIKKATKSDLMNEIEKKKKQITT